MKNLLTSLLILCSFVSFSQELDTTKLIINKNYGYRYKRWVVDSQFILPIGGDTLSKIAGQTKIIDNDLWFIGVNNTWRKIQSGLDNLNSGTIAQLRAMGTTTGKIYFPTDRGGGPPFLDLGLNDGRFTDDGALYIITINGHALQRQQSGMWDPRWWGVIGDGTHDDTQEMNAALAAAQGRTLNTTGLVVKVKSRGGYALIMHNNVNLYADKARGMVIRADSCADSTAILRIDITNNNGFLDVRDQRIENIAMFHNGGGKNGIEVVGAMSNTRLVIQGCNISAGGNGDALYGTNLSFANINTNVFSPSVFLDGVADGNIISGNTFLGPKCGITLNIVFGAYNNTIEKNVIPNRDGAIHIINGSQVKILNNQIEHALAQGESQGNKFSHIWIEGRDYTSTNITIVDNNGGGGTNLDHFLTIDNATYTYVDRNLLNATDSTDIVLGPLSFDNRIYPNNKYQSSISDPRPDGLVVVDSGTNNFHPRTGRFVTSTELDDFRNNMEIGNRVINGNYLRFNGISNIPNTALSGLKFYNNNSSGYEVARIESFLGSTNVNDGYLSFKLGNSGTFNEVKMNQDGTVTAATPTATGHLTTKAYVDGLQSANTLDGVLTRGNSSLTAALFGGLSSVGIKANRNNVASTTVVGSFASLYDDGSNVFGFDLGYNARYRLRGVVPNSSDFSIATYTSSSYPTAQSDLTDRFIVNGTTGDVSIPTGTLTISSTTTSSQYKLSALNTAPSSATDTGTTGEIRVTAGFIYICTATNTWVRSALTTW